MIVTEMHKMEKAEDTTPKMIKLYTMAENELYINLCVTVYQLKAPIALMGALNTRSIGTMKHAIERLSPDVVLISLKNLKEDTVKELEQIRTEHPQLGLVLLLEVCNARDAAKLRRLTLLKIEGGTAIFLKKRLDKIEWLCTAVSAVSEGQLIFDAALTAYMFAGKPGYAFLKKFSFRELEILNLLSNGYTNAAIASVLYIDIKTVEHHLNNMYGKLKIDHEFTDKHLRVSVAKLYLEAIEDLGDKESPIVHSPTDNT